MLTDSTIVCGCLVEENESMEYRQIRWLFAYAVPTNSTVYAGISRRTKTLVRVDFLYTNAPQLTRVTATLVNV